MYIATLHAGRFVNPAISVSVVAILAIPAAGFIRLAQTVEAIIVIVLFPRSVLPRLPRLRMPDNLTFQVSIVVTVCIDVILQLQLVVSSQNGSQLESCGQARHLIVPCLPQ